MQKSRTIACVAMASLSLAGPAPTHAASRPADAAILPPEVQVTATRRPVPVDSLPESLTIIPGTELRERGASDLRTALALVAGVDAPPGGDTGPAGAVPSLWGLHEFDAFLLVIDGVPAGGTFNPALATLDLHDVERIEILKGAAPVMYGATSFVGVIQVIRYPAGASADELQVAVRSRAGASADLATRLPALGDYRQSLVVGAERNRLTGRDQGDDRVHLLYRGATPLGAGNATVDAEYTAQTQLPTSPVVRARASLTSLTPLDANFNPADATIVEHRTRLTLGYGAAVGGGEWRTRLSYARSLVRDVRGFIRSTLAIGPDGNNADGFAQARTIDDVWFDSFVDLPLSPSTELTLGVDWLYGRGTQQSRNFAYVATLDGVAVPPSSASRHVDEINGLDDRRSFGGLYTQLQWRPAARLAVLAGIRLNRTEERQLASHVDTLDSGNNLAGDATRRATRLSGSLGISERLWGSAAGRGEGHLFADYRNTFKPAAIDFGPDFNPAILKPEAANGFAAGLRGRDDRLRVEWELAAFVLDFQNLVVHSTDASGGPILANAGRERFRGIEAELRWRPAADMLLSGAYSYHDARFGDTFAVESGSLAQLGGHQLALSPHQLASAGALFAPRAGLRAGVQLAYVGRRFLDRLGTAPIGGYATVDAETGYRHGRATLRLVGRNLTNRRDPVTGSEFGERSFYRLPARQLELAVSVDLGP